MIKLILCFCAFWISLNGITQCLNESFNNMGPYGGYQTETWVGDDGYTFTATDARTDLTINGKAICVQNGTLSVANVAGGIGDLTVTTQREYSGGSGLMDLRVNGVSVGAIPYDGTVQTTTITNINITGTISLEIDATNSSSDRVKIDDLTWTCHSGNTISTSNVTPLTFNVDCTTGDAGTVDFTSSGTFNAGNIFTAQLSDATGSFASPVDIGSLSLDGSGLSGTISFTIPAGTPSGTAYRIRVVSDNPYTVGSDNGTDITVNLSGGPCFQEPPHMKSVILNSCNSICGEGNNEVIFGNTGDYSVLMNSTNFEVTYGSTASPTDNLTDPLVSNPTTTSDLNDSTSCPGLFVDATNTTIPPNSTFMLANDAICPGDVLDFGNLCGSGPVYVVYSQDPTWQLGGTFSNSTTCTGGIRYFTTTITATDGSVHTIDYSYDCSLNTGTDGDYAKWDYNGGMAIEQGNNGCKLDPVVLPVELLQLNVVRYKDEVEISWTTASERDNNYFVVSHSMDGYNFDVLSTIPGAGNSVSSNFYQSVHLKPEPGINYYRLQSVDFDGTVHLKGIRSVEFIYDHVYYDSENDKIILPSADNYHILGVDGKLIKSSSNSTEIPFTGKGIYFIQNLSNGISKKIHIH